MYELDKLYEFCNKYELITNDTDENNYMLMWDDCDKTESGTIAEHTTNHNYESRVMIIRVSLTSNNYGYTLNYEEFIVYFALEI
jgi:hypothetical protein